MEGTEFECCETMEGREGRAAGVFSSRLFPMLRTPLDVIDKAPLRALSGPPLLPLGCSRLGFKLFVRAVFRSGGWAWAAVEGGPDTVTVG